MSESKLHFFKKLNRSTAAVDAAVQAEPGQSDENPILQRLEPSTCVEAETFVLQVLDDSMEPEFRKNCMIVIDPTGHAKDGSYVLARCSAAESTGTSDANDSQAQVEQLQFRQLRRSADQSWQLCSLNEAYPSVPSPADFSNIVGVIVQRAGTRRRYHKRYD